MTSIRTRLSLTLIGAALALSACGGGGQAFDVAMTEFAFAPNGWTVTAGEEVTVELTNTGTVEHNWTIVELGAEISSEGDLPGDRAARADRYVFQGAAGPGQTARFTFTAPPAGEYQVICDIPAHFGGGMHGTLTVEQ